MKIYIQETNKNIIGVVDYSTSPSISLDKKIKQTKKLSQMYPMVDDFIWIKRIKDQIFDMDLISPYGEVGDMCGNGIICVLKALKKEYENRKNCFEN